MAALAGGGEGTDRPPLLVTVRALPHDRLEVAIGEPGHLLDRTAELVEQIEPQPACARHRRFERHHHRPPWRALPAR